MSIKDVIGQFPAGLFFILVGATLLFAIVRINGTIDLLAYWAERLAGDRKILVPILMFLLTAALASAGAFTPAAITMVAPVGLALGPCVTASAAWPWAWSLSRAPTPAPSRRSTPSVY